MIVEVVAVGTELLLGEIINSNLAQIGRRLATNGLDTHFQTVVGDNLERLVDALDRARHRSDAVVITGGIGPTQDDLTREALCVLAGVPMTRDETHAAWITDRLRSQGRDMADNVLRMADLPDGALGLANGNGVALGVAIEVDGSWLFATPGVPAEMIPMLEGEVLPRLRRLAGEPTVLRSRVLHCWGAGESTIADRLDELFTSANPTVAFLIRDMEVDVRITAKADADAAAQALIQQMEDEVRERLGDLVFAVGDQKVERLVLDLLASRGWAVATVERATLGQVGARLAAADESGEHFAGSLVPGRGQTGDLRSDVVVRVEEIQPDAGPGPRTTRAVEISVKSPTGTTARVFEFGGDDERLRSFATIAGLHMLRLALNAARPA